MNAYNGSTRNFFQDQTLIKQNLIKRQAKYIELSAPKKKKKHTHTHTQIT